MIEIPESGAILAGKYRVDRVLGQGGMGVVVAALHLELDQLVAVKFLHQEALGNPEALARFTREARAAARIKSEHVARVIDVSRLDNGAPYMVMEYLEGEDLAARSRSGRLSVEEAADYVVQACDAVAEAHAVGIVHRDLKPSNLFLTRRANGDGWVKVLDFGISKLLVDEAGAAAGLTSTAALMGSPLYMSPEQMRSARDVDTRADLWALGAILYELLSAHPPFSGQSLPEVINAVMTSEPLALSQFRADVPPALEQTILRCLVKDRTLRLQTVAELATDLAAFAPRRSQHVVARVRSLSIPPSPSAQGASVSAPHEPASVRITEPAWSGTQGSASLQARANNRARWAIIGALALGLAGVSLALSRSRSIGPVNSASAGGPVEAESLIVASAPPLVGEAVRVPVSEPSVMAAVPSATSRPPVNPPQRRRVLATPKPAGELPAAATVSSSGRRRNLDIEIK